MLRQVESYLASFLPSLPNYYSTTRQLETEGKHIHKPKTAAGGDATAFALACGAGESTLWSPSRRTGRNGGALEGDGTESDAKNAAWRRRKKR